MNIQVRTCTTLDDVQVLTDYGAKLAEETEDKVLDKELVAGGVKSLIERPKFGVYYLAEVINEDGSK